MPFAGPPDMRERCGVSRASRGPGKRESWHWHRTRAHRKSQGGGRSAHVVTGVAWESWQRWWTQAAPPALTSAATAVLTPWLTPWLTLRLTPWPTPWLTLWLVRDTARTSARRTGRWALSLQCATGCSRRDEHSRGGKNAATHMFVPTRTASAVAAEQGRGDRASPSLSSRASPVKSTAAQVSARWRTVNEPKPRSVEDLRGSPQAARVAESDEKGVIVYGGVSQR